VRETGRDVSEGAVGGADAGAGAAHDQAHEIDDGREQEFARVLLVGFLLEEGIEVFRN